MWSRREQIAVYDFPREGGGQVTPAFGPEFYLDAIYGHDGDTGKSSIRPLKTITEVFGRLLEMHTHKAGSANHARINMIGPFFENLTAPVGVTGVSMIGCANAPRWGSLTNASEGGGASWRTASGVTDEPLLILINQGWRLENILFAGPSAETAIEIQSDGTATPEITGGSCIIRNCRFAAGKYAITDNGGSGWVWVLNNDFEVQTTGSIVCLSTANAIPTGWRIQGNRFWTGSASHILSSATNWTITDNTFNTVAASALYINLQYNASQGSGNMLTRNTFGGVYTTGDYLFDSTDLALGNWVAVVSTQAPNGFTVAIPTA